MQLLTVGKKKKDDAISKGAKIGASIGGVRGALGGAGVAKALGMSNKAALGIGAAQAAGGAIKGAIVGAGIGAGVKAVKNRKKKNFSSTGLTEFKKNKETGIIGQFPKPDMNTDTKSNTTDTKKKKKSVFDEASDKVKNKDKLPTKSDNVPENIKTGVTSKLLMRK